MVIDKNPYEGVAQFTTLERIFEVLRDNPVMDMVKRNPVTEHVTP
jgi:hypothetical protein